ncbi:MAG: ribosome-associated translation inhibitor RaiA [Candidatus Omnitrophica bacterium]|nr:ribosome-associated translation inhibitor RaiA [Candidatus Omnitrophota bacterium]
MEINITGRNIELNSTIKDYVQKKMDKLDQMYGRIYGCEVVLEEEKERKNVEVILYLKKNKVVAKESSPDIFASIDNASENVKKQLRRLTGKLSSRRRKAMLGRLMNPFRSAPGTAEKQQGMIVKSNTFADKPMLPEEAKLELDVLNRNFIVFRNAETGEVNVIYKRGDGNYGIVEPKF